MTAQLTHSDATTIAEQDAYGDPDPAEIFAALQTIIADVDTFVAHWFEQIDRCVEPSNAAETHDAILRKRVREFQREKRLWEARRETEQQELQEKADQLSQAWLHLEAEQRRFLQLKESQPMAGRDRTPTPTSIKEAAPPPQAAPPPY